MPTTHDAARACARPGPPRRSPPPAPAGRPRAAGRRSGGRRRGRRPGSRSWRGGRAPRWSRSATSGRRNSRLPSLSSASATSHSPCPTPALEPMSLSSPPTRNVGSRPHWRSTWEIIDEVVVLPWVPATAMPRRMRHDAGEHLGAPQHGQSGGARGAQLGVARGDGRGDHDQGGVAEVGGVVADGDGDAGLVEVARVAGRLEVRAGDVDAELVRAPRRCRSCRRRRYR